jgi:hypothetical protein
MMRVLTAGMVCLALAIPPSKKALSNDESPLPEVASKEEKNAETETNNDNAGDADAPQVFARPKLKAELPRGSEVWVGQKLEVEVSLYRDEQQPIVQVPEIPIPEVSRAIVVEGNRPAPMVQDEGDTRYIVHKRTYLVFSQQKGTSQFPSISVSLRQNDDTPPTTVKSDAIAFKTFALPGKMDPSKTVVTPNLTVTQKLEGNLQYFKVGDAITRFIHISAADTDAVMIPPVVFEKVDGMTLYAAEPEVRGSSNRGVYTAERIEKATYVAEKWGWYTLPEIVVNGFDPKSRRENKAVAEPIRFRARANLALGLSSFGDPLSNLPTLLFVLALFSFIVAVGFRLRGSIKNRKTIAASTERMEKARFKSALKAQSPIDMMNKTYRWIEVAPAHPERTMDRFGRCHGEFDKSFKALLANAFGRRSQNFGISSFPAVLKKTRREEISTLKKSTKKSRSLNPSGGDFGRHPARRI